MTREEKIATLEKYCDKFANCDDCELMMQFDGDSDYYCVFKDMSDKVLDKVYDYYTNIDSTEPTKPDKTVFYYPSNIPAPAPLTKAEKHMAICHKLNSIYQAKNHDYGDAFGDTFKKLGIISAVTRLSDKMNRLMSLAVSQDAQVKDEKIEDTLMDMANYAVMTLIEMGYIDDVKKVDC